VIRGYSAVDDDAIGSIVVEKLSFLLDDVERLLTSMPPPAHDRIVLKSAVHQMNASDVALEIRSRLVPAPNSR
jgi:hypothetical protein